MQLRYSHLFKLTADDSNFQFSIAFEPTHFNTSELRCKCCENLLIDGRLIEALEKLRLEIGKPLIITSGYRCPKHNEAIGGVKGSGHTKGISADIATPPGFSTVEFGLITWQRKKILGIKRVGIYDGYQNKHGFIHIGVKKHPYARDYWGDFPVT